MNAEKARSEEEIELNSVFGFHRVFSAFIVRLLLMPFRELTAL
jgi:hypothetical protein